MMKSRAPDIASAQPIGSDQVTRLTPGKLVFLLLAVGATIATLLGLADSWVWTNVSATAAFEAIAAESNVGIALAAFYAIWSSSSEARSTRDLIHQLERKEMEYHSARQKSIEGDALQRK